MSNDRIRTIKKAQKESQLFQELSKLFLEIALDDTRLSGIFLNRVSLSANKSLCTVYFYTPDGKEAFEKKLPFLILYKPSMRKALSSLISGRYTPNLKFTFDEQFEKQQHIESLLDAVSREPRD
jgi:ribosome-binding factor A